MSSFLSVKADVVKKMAPPEPLPIRELTQELFAKQMNKVLSPASVIRTIERLHGRSDALGQIQRALLLDGRHIFIHGHRGVGKTSLAETAANQAQSADQNHISVVAENVFDTMVAVALKAFPSDPREIKKVVNRIGGISKFGFSAKYAQNVESGNFQRPENLNEALALVDFIGSTYSDNTICVIDEFDRLTDENDKKAYADFIKSVSDRASPIRFIFCGIGEDVQQLITAHYSVDRCLHTVKLDRLGYDPRLLIIDIAFDYLGVKIDHDTRVRVAQISDGFPHYVHLICEKILWEVFQHSRDPVVSTKDFDQGLSAAINSIEIGLKSDYEKASQKYKSDYEPILWAMADTHEFMRSSTEIWSSYQKISEQMAKKNSGWVELTRSQFNGRMGRLKKDASAHILRGSRAGWYEYREKMTRGYARLRAAQQGIVLSEDHPLA